jgi:hypothetical protein
MVRKCVYLVALLGTVGAAGTGLLFAMPDGEDTPLFIPVDVTSENPPERFTVALGDVIVFHSFSQSQPPLPSTTIESGLTPPVPRGDVVLRIKDDSGVLGDTSAIRFANFKGGKLQVDYGGMTGRFVKAKKGGIATVEATTHRGGTRREVRDFEITVVEKRQQPVPVD